MTTIAYRNGIVAADTGATCLGSRNGFVDKIVKSTAGDIAGGTGSAAWCGEFKRWFLAGEIGEPPKITDRDSRPIGKGIIFRVNGDIVLFESDGFWTVRAPYFALGSGQDIATGAFWKEATAEEAVRAAIEHDADTFGSVTVLQLGKVAPEPLITVSIHACGRDVSGRCLRCGLGITEPCRLK